MSRESPGRSEMDRDSTSDAGLTTRGAPQCHIAALFIESYQRSKEMKSAPVWRLTQVRLETGYNDSVWIMEASISVSHSNIVTLSGCLFIRTRTGHSYIEHLEPVILQLINVIIANLIWEKMSQLQWLHTAARFILQNNKLYNASLKSPETVSEANSVILWESWTD